MIALKEKIRKNTKLPRNKVNKAYLVGMCKMVCDCELMNLNNIENSDGKKSRVKDQPVRFSTAHGRIDVTGFVV